MLDYLEFVSKKKSILIAPAGYGKTHTIAESLKHTQAYGKQLILTHTHAGVASIKEKIKKEGIPTSCYCIETITSFAQKYVLSFYTGKDIPEQEDSTKYYPFILENAIELFKLKPIKYVIANTYKGLFVDEYQDCTITQHELILLLSELFPTHILGDFLQGIFGFNDEQLVNLEDTTQMGAFLEAKYELDTPQRWLRGNNAQLGNELKTIRDQLIRKENIDLTSFPSITIYVCKDIYQDKYTTVLNLLKEGKSILIIDPVSTSIYSRISFIKKFKCIPRLIESIDDKDFYILSKEADLITTENVLQKIIYLCHKLFNKTGVNNWFNSNGFKKKINEKDRALVQPIKDKIKLLDQNISFSYVSNVLREIKSLPEMKCYRIELFNSFCKALEEAEYNKISVLEAMTNKRNSIRRGGRKIYGRCIGTTLLTKGLEFDSVLIINAHKFDCPKHLYVALTRASKKLVVFTENAILKPYQ